MITQEKRSKKEYSSSSLVKKNTSTYLVKKSSRQNLRLEENQSAVMIFKIQSLIFRQMSTKFSGIQQKMCEIPIFFLTKTCATIINACVNESRHFGALSQKRIS